MTYYILAGGADRRTDGYGEELSKAVYSFIDRPAKILSVQFSQEKDEWQEKFDGWVLWFHEYLGSDADIKLASPDTLLEQLTWADVIYFHGGRTQNLLGVLNQFGDIEPYFKDKVVVGSSAGTNFLSKYYFSPKQNKIDVGSGIVPLNTIVHYGAADDGEISLTPEAWEEVVVKMKALVKDEELTLLPEGKFVVYEK
jgi:peptidase E